MTAQGGARNERNPGNPTHHRHRHKGADGVLAGSCGGCNMETACAPLGRRVWGYLFPRVCTLGFHRWPRWGRRTRASVYVHPETGPHADESYPPGFGIPGSSSDSFRESDARNSTMIFPPQRGGRGSRRFIRLPPCGGSVRPVGAPGIGSHISQGWHHGLSPLAPLGPQKEKG